MSDETNSNCTDGPALTREALEEALSILKRGDPVANYMRENGFDPDKGDLMIVPAKLWEQHEMPERPYIKKSDLITDQMFLMKSPMSILATMPEFDYTPVKLTRFERLLAKLQAWFRRFK